MLKVPAELADTCLMTNSGCTPNSGKNTVDDVVTDQEWPHAIEGYMHGRCAHLAVQVHRKTGLSLVEITSGNKTHVICVDQDGMAIDIMGRRPIEEIADEWSYGRNYRLLPIADDGHVELLQVYDDPRNDQTLDDELWARRLVAKYLADS